MDCVGEKNDADDEKKYIVRVLCQSKSLFVEFAESELNIVQFPEKIANIFGIKADEVNSGLTLTDNLGFPIPKLMLAEIIKKFHSGSMFYIKVDYKMSSSQQANISIVTVDMLESFFRRQNKAELLSNRNVKILDDKVRLDIVNCLVDFAVEAFGKGNPYNIDKEHKKSTARAAVCLFEGLKSNDPMNETAKLLGHNGFLSNRLKYLKRLYAEHNVPNVSNESNVDEATSQLSGIQITPGNDLEFLKNSIIKNLDQTIIVAKLKATQKHREAMMKDANIDLRQSFPFFFAEPRLIALDFDINPKFICDSGAFIENWPKYGPKVRSNVDANIATDWEGNIENLLLLMHVFPSKGLPLCDAMRKLIVFRVIGTPPDKMIESDNQHPYIVAYGISKKEIISFYIEAERHLIPLPSDFSIVDTFDIFFKLHFVFGLAFDKSMENMMVFVQRLIYNLRKGRASTAAMQSFFEKLMI